MKILYTILIIILASLYKADDSRFKYCSQWTRTYAPSQPSDCHNLWINETFTPGYYYKCCYVAKQYYFNGNFHNETSCTPVTKEYYDTLIPRVKSELDFYKISGSVIDKFVTDCSSNYLYISLLSLIIFLL